MGNCCQRFLPSQLRDLTTQLNEKGYDENQNQIDTNNSVPDTGVNSLLKTVQNSIGVNILPSEIENALNSGPLILKNLVNVSMVVRLQNMFFDQINFHFNTLTKIKESNFENFFEVSSFAENINKETGFEKITVLYQKFKSNYCCEFLFFGMINQLVPLYDTVEEHETVHFEPYEDIIFIVERARTKRVLVIASRHTLVLRVIRRLGKGRILDISQSIELNELLSYPTLKSLYEEKVKHEPASLIIGGYYYEDKEDHCLVSSFSKVDFHMTVPLKFAAFFLRRAIDEFFDRMNKNMSEHQVKNYSDEERTLRWFKDTKKGEFFKPEFVENKVIGKFGNKVETVKDEVIQEVVKENAEIQLENEKNEEYEK